MEIYKLLKPIVTKIKRLPEYQQAVTGCVSEVISYYGDGSSAEGNSQKTSFNSLMSPSGGGCKPTSEFAAAFAELLDTLILVDYLKSMKPCLNNDFSLYKR
jgi:hypothetical protein